ncbi:MAG: SpoIIE family protein phosphatase [Nannocystaceae bacterium]
MARASLSFRTKLILIAGVSVAAGLALSGGAAYLGLSRLGEDAVAETRNGLGYATREYLENHIRNVSQRLSDDIVRAKGELATFAAITQTIFDHRDEFEPVLDAAAALPYFRDNLVYTPPTDDKKGGDWAQNGADEPTTVTVWGYLLDHAAAAGEPRALREDVARAVDDTAILDLFMPAMQRNGSRKLQIYYVGPTERPYARFAPAKHLGETLDHEAEGHNATMFWDFFFPGIVKGWSAWVGDRAQFDDPAQQITLTPPYNDAAGGGPVVTLFQPLWSLDRRGFAGALGFDLSLGEIIKFTEELKIFGSGFAFLAQDNGNVFAVNDAGRKVLGLKSPESGGALGEGLTRFELYLKDSSEAALRELALPAGDRPVSLDLKLGGHAYAVVLQRLDTFNVWAGTDEIHEGRWVLGFVVPDDEVYVALHAAEASVAESSRGVLLAQIMITILTLAVVMFGVILVSRRITKSLVDLARSARRIAKKDYDVSVEIDSDDEIGELGQAFGQMVGEIKEYTRNLEGLVEQRTAQLKAANREIVALNERLKAENLRMGAELDVARRLQMMVLPATSELEAVSELDIAGFMRPADEVGGDYYDVLRGARTLKIGIGDVTGHGLESGVLMLMVQTAIRTLIASEEGDPRRFLDIVNRVICANITRIGVDRTLTLSLLDYQGGVLTLAGQHEEVIIVRAGGEVERIDTMDLGLPIGLEPDIGDFIDLKEIRLGPGDVVALYTDGITEAEDMSGERYEMDRLCAVLERARGGTADEIRDAVIADVMGHIGDNKILDDITTVILKRIA